MRCKKCHRYSVGYVCMKCVGKKRKPGEKKPLDVALETMAQGLNEQMQAKSRVYRKGQQAQVVYFDYENIEGRVMAVLAGKKDPVVFIDECKHIPQSVWDEMEKLREKQNDKADSFPEDREGVPRGEGENPVESD